MIYSMSPYDEYFSYKLGKCMKILPFCYGPTYNSFSKYSKRNIHCTEICCIPKYSPLIIYSMSLCDVYFSSISLKSVILWDEMKSKMATSSFFTSNKRSRHPTETYYIPKDLSR